MIPHACLHIFQIGSCVHKILYVHYGQRSTNLFTDLLTRRGKNRSSCAPVNQVQTTNRKPFLPLTHLEVGQYYVLAMNAGSLGGNRYVTFTLSGLVDIPSLIICFFLIKRYAVCKCSSFISMPQMRNKVLVRSTDDSTCLSAHISNRFMCAQDFIRPLWIEKHQPVH